MNFAKIVRRLSIPIAIFWLALAALTNALVPSLEDVGRDHNVAQSPREAPSLIATQRTGEVFQEYDSDSLATIVLEGEKPLGAEAHQFGDVLVAKMEAEGLWSTGLWQKIQGM